MHLAQNVKSIEKSLIRLLRLLRFFAIMIEENSIIVLVSITNRENAANALAEGLVEKKLAACVQILPITSVYRWKGKMEHDSEQLLIIKTRKELGDLIIQYIQSHHDYEIPETVILPITGGSPRYLNWIRTMTV